MVKNAKEKALKDAVERYNNDVEPDESNISLYKKNVVNIN
jgi:hypothetical protein